MCSSSMSLLLNRWTRSVPRLSCRPLLRHQLFSVSVSLRNEANNGALKTLRVNYEEKYAEKLKKKAEEAGLSTEELKERKKTEEQARQKTKQAQVASTKPESSGAQMQSTTASPTSAAGTGVRKDSSPVKPLSTILSFDKLIQNPLEPPQLTQLWHAYHQRLSGGTGRGYLSAVISRDTYEQMLSVAQKYPQFVVPLPREAVTEEGQRPDNAINTEAKPLEFFFMEWGFHGSPSEPRTAVSVIDDLVNKSGASAQLPNANPQTSTVLFTPLGEYKLRNSFATPYLVLTFYTDLARTHGLVLLRGEITPGPGAAEGGDARYLLSQLDAQALAISVQKFYLWGKLKSERECPVDDQRSILIKTFHEDPANFKWEDLLKHT